MSLSQATVLTVYPRPPLQIKMGCIFEKKNLWIFRLLVVKKISYQKKFIKRLKLGE